MPHSQEGCNARTHRIPHDIGSLDLQMVEQRTDIIGHGNAVICGWVIKFARRTVAAIVERNDASAGTVECADPSGLYPIDFLCGRKAVNERDRLAFPFVEICDLDVTVLELWH